MPAAAPFTADMTGLGIAIISCRLGKYPSTKAASVSNHLLSLADRSAPAEKLSPSPVKTIARTSLSTFASINASRISSVILALNAFLTSGRLNLIKATAPLFS